MRNGKWMKAFGIGIIILFLETCVLPSITAKVVSDDNINNSKMNEVRTITCKGLVSWLNHNSVNKSINYKCILVFYRWYDSNGVLIQTGYSKRGYNSVTYISYSGYIGHFILWAKFDYMYTGNTSGMIPLYIPNTMI